jgi:hypothetical protein
VNPSPGLKIIFAAHHPARVPKIRLDEVMEETDNLLRALSVDEK